MFVKHNHPSHQTPGNCDFISLAEDTIVAENAILFSNFPFFILSVESGTDKPLWSLRFFGSFVHLIIQLNPAK